MTTRLSTTVRLGLALIATSAVATVAAGPASADGTTVNTGSAVIDGAAALLLSPVSAAGTNGVPVILGSVVAGLGGLSSTGSVLPDPSSAVALLNPQSAIALGDTLSAGAGALSSDVSPVSAGDALGSAGTGSVVAGNVEQGLGAVLNGTASAH